MKQSNRRRSNMVFACIIAVILLALGLVVWYVLKNNTLTSGVGSDCGSNRQCFYQAFSSGCMQKTLKSSYNTIEGDPIVTTAEITQGAEGCIVEVTVDGSQDEYAFYGSDNTSTYTCKKLAQNDGYLTASECTSNAQGSSVDI